MEFGLPRTYVLENAIIAIIHVRENRVSRVANGFAAMRYNTSTICLRQ